MDNETFNISGNQSPTKNPFCTGHVFSELNFGNTSLREGGRPSLTAVLNDCDDFLTRESLGILPNSTLIRDSLTSDFASTSFRVPSIMSPRESLGILNISAMDLGRESLGIFNINNPVIRREENEAFQLLCGNAQSLSHKFAIQHHLFANYIKNIKHRILSLPLTFEENNALGVIPVGNKMDNVSFDEGFICRGIEDDKDLDDSVFLLNNKIMDADTSFHCGDKSFDGEKYLLDCTPQPDWSELEALSKSNIEDKEKSPTYSKEGVSKTVEKMLGMQPENLVEKLKLKNSSKCDSTCSVNVSHNISKISRASQCSPTENLCCGSNNFSQGQECQDVSKISHTSEENVCRLMRNLSDIINEKENLSPAKRGEGHRLLQRLTDLLCETGNHSVNSEDSGQHAAHLAKKDKAESAQANNEKALEALDLSCKNKSRDNNFSRSKSLCINNSPTYAGASFGTDKIKKNTTYNVPSKKGPLRAVLPIENMAKDARNVTKISHGNVTPDKNDKCVLKSKKTSTPLQEPKLKPMAASTPTNRSSNAISPANNCGKPKLTRSFSNQSRTSSFSSPGQQATNNNNLKQGESDIVSKTLRKPSPKFSGAQMVRRNSVTENVMSKPEASLRLKRSFSTGKEPKIMSALSSVRQNILNSPYYNPRKNTSGVQDSNKVSAKKIGKENVKP